MSEFPQGKVLRGKDTRGLVAMLPVQRFIIMTQTERVDISQASCQCEGIIDISRYISKPALWSLTAQYIYNGVTQKTGFSNSKSFAVNNKAK